MSFQIGLSGLNASSRNLDIIGHNIANANTTGMKSSRVEFSEVIANSLGTGGGDSSRIGVTVSDTTQQFSQGNITVTSNDLDVAINGGGFFQLRQPDGSFTYTRNGAFRLDNLGNIVSQSGAKLMGYPAGAMGSSVTVPLSLPSNAPIAANQTSAITASFNLDARVGYATTIPGVTAQYTTTAIAAADYSTILGTPASYTTAPLGTVFYGVAGTPQVDGKSSVVTHSASINFSQPFVAQVDGYNTQTITSVAGSNAQASATDAGMTGNYTGGGVGPLSFTVDATPVNLSADYTGNRAGFIADVQTALGAGYLVTDLGLGLGFSIARATASATQAVAISAANLNAMAAGIADSAGTGTFNATAYDFSGAGLAQFNVDGIAVTLDANYTDDAGLAGAIAADLGAGYTVTVAGPADIRISKNGSLLPVAITSVDVNAVAAGFSNSAGTPGASAIPADAISFLVDGTAVNLTGNYADTQALADAITGQLTGYTATINEGSDTIQLTKTGSLAAVVISANTAATAQEQTNAITAGFVASSGIGGIPAASVTPADVTLTPPGGAAFTVSLSGSLDAAGVLAAIQGTAGYGTSGFTASIDGSGGLVLTSSSNTAGPFTVSSIDPTATGIITGSTSVSGVADDASPNASFTITAPGGTAFNVAVTSNITGALDLATAIQNSPGYATSGFTVVATPNDNSPSSTLVFTADNNTAADFTIGGTDPTVLTAGTPVVVTGVADDISPNATFDLVGPGGIPITVNLTGPIADANAMATAIQNTAGYATSGFTVTVNGSDLVFAATSANTAGDITISGADASILTTGGTSITGLANTTTGTVIPRTTYGTSLTAYDMQGVPTPVSLYFTKISPTTPGTDEWAVYDSLTGPSIGSLIFNADGSLNSSTVTQLTLTPTSPQSVVPPFPVTVDFSKTTQYGTNFSVSELTQDGYTSGELVGLKIGDDGTLTARYSNGESQTAGQIALVNFRNLNGLIPVGAGGWLMSPESGVPLPGSPGVASFGSLRAGALEESNVDLTAELVNMMTAQRAYQANAQTIKTQDQVLSTLLNMR